MNRTRKALGTVRQEAPPYFGDGAPIKVEKDGSQTCRVHGIPVTARRGFGVWRAIWSRCPKCCPLTARRNPDWRRQVWLVIR